MAEIGRFNIEKWRQAFNDQVSRLNDAVGDEFESNTEWRKFDVWSMFGTFICTRYRFCKRFLLAAITK
jgi:hypothetical protein